MPGSSVFETSLLGAGALEERVTYVSDTNIIGITILQTLAQLRHGHFEGKVFSWLILSALHTMQCSQVGLVVVVGPNAGTIEMNAAVSHDLSL